MFIQPVFDMNNIGDIESETERNILRGYKSDEDVGLTRRKKI